MKFHSHLNTAVALIRGYSGKEPFHHFIRHFFKGHRKYGSSDRKNITALCYAYFRMGHSMTGSTIEEKMLAGLFLTESEPETLLRFFSPNRAQWLHDRHPALHDRINFLQSETSSFDPLEIFPFKDQLSEEVDAEEFIISHLVQPDLFLRIRPGFENQVEKKLIQEGLPHELISPSSARLSNNTKLENVIEINREAVIQDYSSQLTGDFFPSAIPEMDVWDCCAASGGKAIMAHDLLPGCRLTVSDIRPSILANLKNRFRQAHIEKYKSFVWDLSTRSREPDLLYDLIIADVPCSGSGTWGRTPEQLVFFDPADITEYSELQKRIVSNAIPSLKRKGCLLYITCSVFKEENEEVIKWTEANLKLSLIRKAVIKGYSKRADTMFASLLIAD